jgi:hypothetical protein
VRTNETPDPFTQDEYAYSGVRDRHGVTIVDMLWSDPENEPPKELRDTQDMLRRLGVLMALAMVLAMIVLGVM